MKESVDSAVAVTSQAPLDATNSSPASMHLAQPLLLQKLLLLQLLLKSLYTQENASYW